MMTCNSQVANCRTACLIPAVSSGTASSGTTTSNATGSTACLLTCSSSHLTCQTVCAQVSPSRKLQMGPRGHEPPRPPAVERRQWARWRMSISKMSGAPSGGQAAHLRRDPAHRRQHREAAEAVRGKA
jgi:hypothetical protein